LLNAKICLRLYSKGCKNIPFAKLDEVVSEYRRLHYAKGAVELSLRCAQDWDSDGNGIGHWLDGSPANDPRIEAYTLRRKCYELVLGTLEFFDQLNSTAQDPTARDIVEDAQLVSQIAYRTALNSGDPAFHSALYEWLIERGSADELLEVGNIFGKRL
jgi:nuclear pore complex protein Nup155